MLTLPLSDKFCCFDIFIFVFNFFVFVFNCFLFSCFSFHHFFILVLVFVNEFVIFSFFVIFVFVNENHTDTDTHSATYSPVEVIDGVVPMIFYVPRKASKAHTDVAPWHLHQQQHALHISFPSYQ